MPKESNCMIWFVPMTEHRFGWGVTSPIPASVSNPDAGQGPHDKETKKTRISSSDTSGSPRPINRLTRSFSALSTTSHSPPPSIDSHSHYDHLQPHPSQPQPQSPSSPQHTTSLKKRQSFGRLSKASSTGSSGSQSSFQKYPAVLQSIYSSETASSIGESCAGAGPHLPYNRVWGQLEDQYVIEESIREQPSPYGGNGVFGDFVDATARSMISMVVVEEKFYHTWHFGRTVLLGDACHKLLPSSGHGATQAILDAISLVSLLVDLPSNSATDIDALFRVHYERRGPPAKAAVIASQQQDQFLFNRKLSGKLIRKMASNWVGDWLQVKLGDRLFDSRPMLPFMKPVPDRGTHPNRDTNVPLLQDKRFEAARRKSISSGEIGRRSGSEDSFGLGEHYTNNPTALDKKCKKKKNKNKDDASGSGSIDLSFDSSPFSSSSPSIIGSEYHHRYHHSNKNIPAVPSIPAIHRPLSSMMDVEGTLIPVGPRFYQHEQEPIDLRSSHWHLYQDYAFPHSSMDNNNSPGS
ncbi:hypothetical protein BGZ94_005298 [Podila epigama]|nr:hypothetical protein BGZ94_005298 [Podila epigama]